MSPLLRGQICTSARFWLQSTFTGSCPSPWQPYFHSVCNIASVSPSIYQYGKSLRIFQGLNQLNLSLVTSLQTSQGRTALYTFCIPTEFCTNKIFCYIVRFLFMHALPLDGNCLPSCYPNLPPSFLLVQARTWSTVDSQ